MKEPLKNIRESAEKGYKDMKEIHCPYFKEKVTFTSEGFNHIRYRKSRNERHYSVQKMRYKLLPLASEVLRNSKTLQEHEIQKNFIEVKRNKKREKIMKEVHFYGFIAIVKDWKVKVIVRQVGEGKKHFWSIIPNWKTRRTKDSKKQQVKHTGDLAVD